MIKRYTYLRLLSNTYMVKKLPILRQPKTNSAGLEAATMMGLEKQRKINDKFHRQHFSMEWAQRNTLETARDRETHVVRHCSEPSQSDLNGDVTT